MHIFRHYFSRIAYICICVFLFTGKAHVRADTELRDSLFELQAQIQGYKDRIAQGTGEMKTIEEATEMIEMRRKKILLEKSLTVVSLNQEQERIAELERKLDAANRRMDKERTILTQLLQDMQTHTTRRLAIALSGASFSAFFDAVHSSEFAHNAVRESIQTLREERRELMVQKKRLEKQREASIVLHEVQLRQEFSLADEDARKKSLQAYTGKRAVVFETLLERSQLAAVDLQEEFFEREGVGKKLSLQEAYARADAVGKKLGLRTAFLVALLAQESHFGLQQGTGAWKEDMDPAQWPGFLNIVQRLGLDPDRTPVSKKPDYGWGGALGPTQFLPLTWLGYEDGIKALTGHTLPSPWNIDDAFAGAALKLSQAGADAKTEAAERRAALIYFAGGNWQNPAFAFYADSILELAKEIEQELKLP